MNVTPILQELDAEISRLQSARETIAGLNGVPKTGTRVLKTGTQRRTMSAAARRRIGAAQRERWASMKRISKTKAA